MALDTAFVVVNYVAIAAWIVLAFAPAAHPIRRLVPVAITLLFAAAYTAILVWAYPPSNGGFGSIADVQLLFAHDELLLAGWIHYLAFDLFVGTWIATHAASRGFHRVALLPILFLTFWVGPVGYLTYRLVDALRLKLGASRVSNSSH